MQTFTVEKIQWWFFVTVLAIFFILISHACTWDSGNGEITKSHLDSLLLTSIDQMEEMDYSGSTSTLRELQQTARKSSYKRYEILALNNFGNLHLRFNKDKEAIEYFLKAEDLAQKLGHERYLSAIYNNIGIIYSTNEAPVKALEYFHKALEISKKDGDEFRIGMNYNNIGEVEFNMGQTEEALVSFAKAIEYAERINDSLNLGQAYTNIGKVFYRNAAFTAAKSEFKKAMRFIPQNDPYYLSEYSLNLGKTYLKLNEADSARQFLEKSEKGFQQMNDFTQLVEVNESLYKHALMTGNLEKANSYILKNLSWKDSILQRKNSQWVSEFQMNYEFGKQEKQIELLERKAQMQTYLWIGIVLFLTLISFYVFLVFRSKNQNLQQKNIILTQEKKMNELEIERNQERQARLKQEIVNNEKINKLKRLRLREEIEYRNRELSTKALNLAKMSDTIASLEKTISQLSDYRSPGILKVKQEASSILRNVEITEQEWDSFFKHFDEVHPQFFSGLTKTYDSLTSNDLKLCAYYVIGLSTKEIAQILHISPGSVRKRKQRLKEKLQLSPDESILSLLFKYRKHPTFSE